jgi:hypothetical protein
LFPDTRPDLPFGLTSITKRANKLGCGQLHIFVDAEATTKRLEHQSNQGYTYCRSNAMIGQDAATG